MSCHFHLLPAPLVSFYDFSAGYMCLYIGDIGDNAKNANKLTIYRIKEPYVKHGWSNHKTKYTKVWSRIYLRYPNGQKFDAESMVIDTKRHEIVIFTKSWNSYGCKVFKGIR